MEETNVPQEGPPDLTPPNAAEKALGYIGAVTVAPLMFPMLPLVAFLRWTTTSEGVPRRTTLVKRILRPLAGAAVFAAFLLICVLAIPYAALYGLLRLLGVVRPPSREELLDEHEQHRACDQSPE